MSNQDFVTHSNLSDFVKGLSGGVLDLHKGTCGWYIFTSMAGRAPRGFRASGIAEIKEPVLRSIVKDHLQRNQKVIEAWKAWRAGQGLPPIYQ